MSGGSKSGEQSTPAANNNESVVKEAVVADENLSKITVKGITFEETSVLGGEKAPLDVVDGDGAIDAKNPPSNSDDFKHPTESQARSSVEDKAKADGEADLPEASEPPIYEPFPENDDDEGGRRDSEIFEEPVADIARAPERPKRYELSYWPDHLAKAEKLWTPEEREKSNEWKELWKLVIQFLCESPDCFKIWQQHYMELDEAYDATNTLLSPLQVAAAYGILGLVQILLDHGEPAAAESEDGRSALWFAADSPDIEIIKLLLQQGASPNACKDFPPPFHVLLWRNPKLEFVSLMLEHEADCKIIDQWGFNVMHWFAMYGSDDEVLKALLKAHGDINVPDTWGETPLHKVMYNTQELSLELLHAFLDNGADVNKDDKDSQSKFRVLLPLCNALTTFKGLYMRFALLEIQRPLGCCLIMGLIFMTMM